MSGIFLGVITAAKSSGTVTVKLGSQIVTAQINRDLTVAAGDPVVVVQIGSSWHVGWREYTSASGDTSPSGGEPPVAPVTRTGQNTFTPVKTASWRDVFGGWRTDNDDVYQGEFGSNGLHIGCWFYGGRPHTLDGATVTKAWINVRRKNGGGITAAQTVTLGHITEKTKPSGEPTFGGGATGPSLRWGQTNTKFIISNTLAQGLVDGTWGGLGIHVSDGSPYVILEGLSDYAASGALTIKWSKSS
jgi:hypothetical protein